MGMKKLFVLKIIFVISVLLLIPYNTTASPLTQNEACNFRGSPKVIFSPDSRYLLSNSNYDEAWVWDVASGEKVFVFRHGSSPDGILIDVAYSTDGRYIATGAYRDTILWNAVTGETVHTFPGVQHPNGTTLFSPDNKYLFVVTTNTVTQWDLSTYKEVQRFTEEITETNHKVELSSDGKYLLINGYSGVKLWDVQTGKLLHNFGMYGEGSISPSGKYVFVRSFDDGVHRITVWDTKTYKVLQKFDFTEERKFNDWQYSPDEKYLISAQSRADSIITLWDIASGNQIHRFELSNRPSLFFLPNEEYLIIREDVDLSQEATYWKWDISSKQIIGEFVTLDSFLSRAAFSPNGRYFAGTAVSGVIYLWDLENSTRKVLCVAF
jgi:WD40 repeat protein